MKKEGGMQKRMQSFYFEFLNEDGTVKEVITNTQDGADQPKPPAGQKPQRKA